MQELAIGEVAKRAGIRPSAVRFYESIGLLPAPRRVNRQRRYDAAVLERLALIQLAQQAGFSIAEITTLFNEFSTDTPPSVRWQRLAGQKIEEIDQLIERAQTVKLLLQHLMDCHCTVLEECVARGTNESGDIAATALPCEKSDTKRV